ncbi:hypothetical protein [Roseibium marinum]|uniref:Uncharacterized protein n=1 Tax=Roseibium marinum TaxID=281252 RepID=A0A2S3USS9_9HYPH|nr:hypothetical protein [Roseibium marinum]POF30529.1 hypothetical protein CLV41_106143 [Roseibium marinum]
MFRTTIISAAIFSVFAVASSANAAMDPGLHMKQVSHSASAGTNQDGQDVVFHRRVECVSFFRAICPSPK